MRASSSFSDSISQAVASSKREQARRLAQSRDAHQSQVDQHFSVLPDSAEALASLLAACFKAGSDEALAQACLRRWAMLGLTSLDLDARLAAQGVPYEPASMAASLQWPHATQEAKRLSLVRFDRSIAADRLGESLHLGRPAHLLEIPSWLVPAYFPSDRASLGPSFIPSARSSGADRWIGETLRGSPDQALALLDRLDLTLFSLDLDPFLDFSRHAPLPEFHRGLDRLRAHLSLWGIADRAAPLLRSLSDRAASRAERFRPAAPWLAALKASLSFDQPAVALSLVAGARSSGLNLLEDPLTVSVSQAQHPDAFVTALDLALSGQHWSIAQALLREGALPFHRLRPDMDPSLNPFAFTLHLWLSHPSKAFPSAARDTLHLLSDALLAEASQFGLSRSESCSCLDRCLVSILSRLRASPLRSEIEALSLKAQSLVSASSSARSSIASRL